MMLPLSAAMSCRLLARTIALCLDDNHRWQRYGVEQRRWEMGDGWVTSPMVVLTLCEVCGHTPLEMLESMQMRYDAGLPVSERQSRFGR